MEGKLHGVVILVPESRELDLFCTMLEAQGAATLRCPMVAILDVADPIPVEAWLARLIAGEFDDLILLTGEGLRRLLALAERTGTKAEMIAALGGLRTIVRGPKPVRVLREIGLAPGLIAASPTSRGLMETLAPENLKGRTVGVQLYPGATDELADFLRAAGAKPVPIVPYRYASEAETGEVEQAIRKMAAGEIAIAAFTSSPQVQRLLEVAKARGLQDVLAAGLSRTRIAAVGPVVAASLEAIGAKIAIQPEGTFHMKPLVNAIIASLGKA